MKKLIIKIKRQLKGFTFLVKPHLFLGFLRRPFLTLSNILSLSKWVSEQDKKGIFNDFYSPLRDYSKRYQLYKYVLENHNLGNSPIDYLEFGVCTGDSFRWWLANNRNEESSFNGFDTFEGLPENWGVYGKGDMAANIPVVNDTRAKFVQGLFQEVLPGFIKDNNLNNGKRKIVHLDADLFSSTLYVLTSLAPHLTKGDIIMFDEFNVPNHEFYAAKIFCESYYFKLKLIGAVNNYFQCAFIIE